MIILETSIWHVSTKNVICKPYFNLCILLIVFMLFFKSVEKALKAGQFSVVVQKKTSHDLRLIAISLGNAQIIGLALSMTNVIGDSYKMRYPVPIITRSARFFTRCGRKFEPFCPRGNGFY